MEEKIDHGRWAANPRLCRYCNHLLDVHESNPKCTVQDCECPGYGMPLTRADVQKQVNKWSKAGLNLAELAEALGCAEEELPRPS